MTEKAEIKPEAKRKAEVMKLLEPFKGKQMDIHEDESGSFTLRRGRKMESIHQSASDRLITAAAQRVCS